MYGFKGKMALMDDLKLTQTAVMINKEPDFSNQ